MVGGVSTHEPNLSPLRERRTAEVREMEIKVCGAWVIRSIDLCLGAVLRICTPFFQRIRAVNGQE
jgi:hypothetical protein